MLNIEIFINNNDSSDPLILVDINKNSEIVNTAIFKIVEKNSKYIPPDEITIRKIFKCRKNFSMIFRTYLEYCKVEILIFSY